MCRVVTLYCQDDIEVSGNGCKVVRAGQVARQVIAAEELPDLERCTSVKRVEIRNIRLLESIE